MKKYLLIAVATLVVLGAGVLSALHYQKYQTKQVQAQVSKETKLTQELAVEKAKHAKLVGQYEKLRTECERGSGAYGSLTPAQAAKIKVTTPPVCGPAVVQ